MRCGAALLALPLVALLVAALVVLLVVALPAGALPAGALPAGALPAGALPAGAPRTNCEEGGAVCPRCPPPPANCSYEDRTGSDEYFYTVDGETLEVKSTEAYLALTCPPGVAPDAASMPAFPHDTLRATVVLRACAAPRAGLRPALRRLGLAAPDALQLRDVPPAPRLAPHALAGLPHLRSLTLCAEPTALLEPPPELLEPLQELQVLFLTRVRLSRAALERLPPRLASLSLVRCGVEAEALSARALGRLTALRSLVLREGRLARAPPLEAAPALRSLFLEAPLAELPPLDRLESVTLEGVRNVTLRGPCAALRRLSVTSRLAALPAGWLHSAGAARCPELAELRLSSLALSELPADLLRGQTALRALTVSGCRRLRTVPSRLFRETRDLRRLVLSRNAIDVLPSEMFTPLRELEELDLSGNRLGALGGVGSLYALRVLVLDRNPLGDTCGGAAPGASFTTYERSPLRDLRALRNLSLAHTGAATLCVDWRRDLHALEKIDFSYNNLTELKYSDMQWSGGERKVDLRGNPLCDVTLSKWNYDTASDDSTDMSRAVLTIDATLNCTCRTYWAARALRESRLRVKLVDLACVGAGAAVSFADAPLADMTCAETRACPPRCACTLRPPNDTLELRCEPRAALPDLAPAAARAPLLELRLAGAELASLPDALPESLRELDLRNATLPAATELQAEALFAHGRVVRLGGARVPCACAGGVRPALLRALRAHSARAPGLHDARCAESGLRVGEEPPCGGGGGGGGGVAWVGALGALAGAVLGLAGAWRAARRDSRLRLKVFLLARGLRPGWAHPKDDDDCLYDVFVSFSHHDFAVASQIVRELEAGPRPLRVCVHYRDWHAGEWIPEQIARSVRQSRRTLVLMSEHFARSEWARAELREAAARALRDVTPRLVVALLGAAPPACLDAELSHIVRGNTYARWGDAAFWDRLRLALPPGRPRAAPPAPSAPPALRPAPPTPVIKFSQMDFPSPIKKPVPVTSPCA